MKYGETYTVTTWNTLTGTAHRKTAVYRRAKWRDYHTNDAGNGLWRGEKQILGTCQFTVCGCATEKAARQKIRRHVSLFD